MGFKEMKISNDIIESLGEIGITQPTIVQKKSIPILMGGKDLICQSETGSGKTLAFAIPIIEAVLHGEGIQALILAPTRELANQILKDIKNASKKRVLNIVNVYGGVPIESQMKKLVYADIVIGTPGRMLDHIRRNTINLSKVKFMVLDEADRMLDMGFIDDVESIIQKTPKNRQTMMFSATMPPEITRLSKKHMKSPEIVKTRVHVKRELLTQYYCDVLDSEKFSALVHLIKTEKPGTAIIFCSTRTVTESVASNLNKNSLPTQALHGGLSQNRRDMIMQDFRHGKIKLLTATDLASRGLDIAGITHIFNYNIPDNPKDYTHRIGRTARAGKTGKAISIISPRDHESFRRVLRDPELHVEKLDLGRFRKIPYRFVTSSNVYANKRPMRRGHVRRNRY